MSQSYCCVIKLKQPKTGRIKKKIKEKKIIIQVVHCVWWWVVAVCYLLRKISHEKQTIRCIVKWRSSWLIAVCLLFARPSFGLGIDQSADPPARHCSDSLAQQTTWPPTWNNLFGSCVVGRSLASNHFLLLLLTFVRSTNKKRRRKQKKYPE